ncbi:MAG: hypothetical protein V3U65_16580 [Granulosicoccaceae bacterium]
MSDESITDDDLLANVEGRIDSQSASRIEQRLLSNEILQTRCSALCTVPEDGIKKVFDQMLEHAPVARLQHRLDGSKAVEQTGKRANRGYVFLEK